MLGFFPLLRAHMYVGYQQLCHTHPDVFTKGDYWMYPWEDPAAEVCPRESCEP